jgi:glycosyltransferase involved in cell wall biosynthesis
MSAKFDSRVPYQAPKILCLIPCFNEAVNLPSLFLDLKTHSIHEVATLLFVDDGSTDATCEFIRREGYAVIQHKKNLGYGGSVKTGFRYAIQNGFTHLVLFPGDHQRSAKDVMRLIEEQDRSGADVVVGSKFHIYSKRYGPIRRRLGNRIYSTIARVMWSSPIEDVLSGFKVYRLARVAPIVERLPNSYALDIVFSYEVARNGLKIREIPVDCRYTETTSKMRSVFWVSVDMLATLIWHRARHLWSTARSSTTVGR